MTSGGDVQLYALIGFIPGALGEFLDAVRRQLVPGCSFRSHVTILPPRLLGGDPAVLSADLALRLERMEALEIGLGEVEIFALSNVIYLAIDSGREALHRFHGQLSRGTFASDEQYPFHPHITLAQEFPAEQLPELTVRARELWKNWRNERRFALREVSFVRGADLASWEHVRDYELNRSPDLKTV